MKNPLIYFLIPTLIVQAAFLSAQCESPNPNASLQCDKINGDQFACDVTDLVGCFTMTDEVFAGNQPMPLCPGQNSTAVNNISWMGFRAPGGSYQISITPFNCIGSTNGNEGMQVGVYTDCEFTDAVFCNANCSLAPVNISGDNFTAGETYYLFIDGCNLSVCQYEIAIEGIYSYEGLFLCADSDTLITATPMDCNEGDFFQTVSGTIDSTCMQANSGCDVTGNTVWYQIQIDSEDAAELITFVEADTEVIWSVYSNYSCLGEPIQELYGNGSASGFCSSEDGNNSNIFVTPIDTDGAGGALPNYWIAVTIASEADTADFTLHYATTLGCPTCNGGTTAADCNNGNFEILVDGQPNDGPFCPGQEVVVCIDLNYEALGNDWLHAIIPSFGNGWDIDEEQIANISPGATYEWFSASGPCAPRLNGYDLQNMCTYEENGQLKFCNKLCDPDCPCEGPLLDGSSIPSGWFANTGGGSPSCGSDCSPASFYGISGGIDLNIAICIPLKVKNFTSGACEESTDLSISVQLTTDAVTGCWEDQSPCLKEASIHSPDWRVNCDGALVSATSVTSCSGDPISIAVQTNEIVSNETLVVTVEDNPNIEGEGMNWAGSTLILPDGSGFIEDVLINTSDQMQTVLYSIATSSGVELCGNTTVSVTILPIPAIELVSTLSTCEGEEVVLTFNNPEDFVSFAWTADAGVLLSTAASLSFIAEESTTISVEATNTDGCGSFASTEVMVGGAAMQEEIQLPLCPGEIVEFNGSFYGEIGTYQDSLVLPSGCVVTYYNLSIIEGLTVQANIDTTICTGQEFMNLGVSGTYVVELPNQTGCDTVLTINLLVTGEPIIVQGEVQYCKGDTIIVGNQVIVDGSGSFQDSIYSLEGCLEQVSDISYSFASNATVSLDTVICEGESVLNQTATGAYSILLSTVDGCDSLILLDLTVLSASDPNCIVGLDELLAQSVNVYPIPATDIIYLSSEKTIDRYRIFDVTGQCTIAASKSISKGLEVDLSLLHPGVYMLHISVEGGVITKKIVVQ